MTFKENLKNKIRAKQLFNAAKASVGSVESGKKIDKDAVRSLLKMGPYTMKKERDLELYTYDGGRETPSSTEYKILVLDNELKFYNTDIQDILIRKSPTVKEMISIRNAVKILNDADVVISKKEESLLTLKEDILNGLDLSYTDVDIREMAADGAKALECGDEEMIREAIALFVEMLGFKNVPASLAPANAEMTADIQKKGNRAWYGPLIIYDTVEKELKLIDKRLNKADEDEMKYLSDVALGNEAAPVNGPEVYAFLGELVIKRKPLLS